jgi:hypothetical protein
MTFHADFLATCRGPHADDGRRVGWSRRGLPGQLAGGDLEGQRVHVDVGRRVDTGHAVQQPSCSPPDVGTGKRPEVSEVEDGAQIDVEAFGSLAGEHLGGQVPIRHAVDGRTGQRRVIRS